jgi:hypothetical protein
MKVLTSVLIFFVIFNICKSQKYEPFINGAKQWKCAVQLAITLKNVNENNEYFELKINYFSGDTIIDDLKYSKSYIKTVTPNSTDTTTLLTSYYFTEDTISQKVFMTDPFSNDTNRLLYDFSLNEGDSVKTYIAGNIYRNGKVKKTDSIYLTNRFLKRITFTDGIEWIEGIGSTENVEYPSNGNLICVKENNDVLFLDSLLFQNCDTAFTELPPTGVDDNRLDISSYKINIYPDPVNQSSVLTIEAEDKQPFGIEIFNGTGVLVRKEYFVGQYPIGTLNLKNGYYFCRVLYKEIQICSSKFIILNN